MSNLDTLKAYKLGKRYPRHVFLTYGNYEAQWWSIQDENTEDGSIRCSPEERAEVLQYSLAAFHFPSPQESASLDLTSNSSTTKLQRFVEARRNGYHNEFEYYHQCYDAVLSLALALDKTIEGRQEICIPYGEKCS